MTTGAWIFMLTVWAIVTAVTVFCYWKTLTRRRDNS